MKNVSCILCSDFHLREISPVCRTDDFWKAQWEKIDLISQIARINNCPVIHAGDLFHHWKPSPYLLNTTIQHLPPYFWTVYGQHDLPQHSLELAEKCGINVLDSANKLKILPECHWGQFPTNGSQFYPNMETLILVWHTMAYKGTSPYFSESAMTAKAILKKYPQFDLIVTGDNHQTFVEEYKGRLLVNPGSLTRQTADQIDHKPCVFLWDAKTNKVEQVFLPIDENAVSREHIEKQEKRNERIDAFISSLNTDWESDVSFKTNLEKFYAKNKINNEVKELITKFTET